MKEELHLNKLTHFEKLNIYIDILKKMQFKDESHSGLNRNPNPYVKLINMMHNYDDYWDALSSDSSAENNHYDYKKSEYVKEMKDLFIQIEGNNANQSSSFDQNLQAIKDSDKMAKSTFYKMHILKLFLLSNKRIFKISKSLIEKLDYTSCNTDVSYIRTPYNAIYVQFPPNFAPDNSSVLSNYKSGVEGAYLSYGDNVLTYLLIPNCKFDMKGMKNTQNILTNCIPSTMNLEGKITIKEIIKLYKMNNSGGFTSQNEYVVITIIKILMYLTSINTDIERITPFGGSIINKKKKKKTIMKYDYVGGNIVINNNNNFAKGLPGRNGRQIETKFMVRGHYHSFWMNISDDIPNSHILDINEDKMLVRKWVEPYWKGKDFAEVILRNYKVV